MKRLLKYGTAIMLELAATLMVTYNVGKIATALAYAERGYKAYGGEWLVIIAVLVASFYVIHNITSEILFRMEDSRMAHTYICADCGAYLDPGEKCDCQTEAKEGAKVEQQKRKDREFVGLHSSRRRIG